MLNLQEVYQKLKAGSCVLVDIREEDELLEEGIAEGAIWVPTSKMEDAEDWNKFKQKLPKDKEVYLYCRSGGRVSRVLTRLNAEGLHGINAGGLKDWKAAQLPVRRYP